MPGSSSSRSSDECDHKVDAAIGIFPDSAPFTSETPEHLVL